MMEKLFLQLISMSIQASCLVMAVILIRFFFRRFPKIYSYVLWSVVGFRLCCPVLFSSALSIFNLKLFDNTVLAGGRQINYFQETATALGGTSGNIAGSTAGSTLESAGTQVMQQAAAAATMVTDSSADRILQISVAVWAAGVVGILIFSMISYGRLKKRVATAVRLKDNIYEADLIGSPFVMGIFNPKIYIPFHMSGKEQQYIIEHERIHIRRGDPLFKLLAFVLLSVYWFNPILWIAYHLMGQDMEMSCDEKVLKQSDESMRKSYSLSLLSFATNHRLQFPGPLAFGESNTGKRVNNIFKNKKTGIGVTVSVVIVIVVLCLVFLTNRKGDTGSAAVQSTVETEQITSGIQSWAEAFCDRDGATLKELMSDNLKKQLMEQGMIDESDSFGMSSPWPWDNATDVSVNLKDSGNETSGTAEIYYYAETSEPHLAVWVETLQYQLEGDLFTVTQEKLEYLDSIDSADAYQKAYAFGIDGTRMDYCTNGIGEALNQIASDSASSTADFYQKLFDPASSAEYLLNIDEDSATGVVSNTGDGANGVHVTIQFTKDNSSVDVVMVQPYGEEGIWVPQNATANSSGNNTGAAVETSTETMETTAWEGNNTGETSSPSMVAQVEDFSEYEKYGLSYDSKQDVLMYDGKTVGYFRDEIQKDHYIRFLETTGEIGVRISRDADWKVDGIETIPMSEVMNGAETIELEAAQNVLEKNQDSLSATEENIAEAVNAVQNTYAEAVSQNNDEQAAPNEEYVKAGIEWKNNTWYYNGLLVSAIYDHNGGIYANDSESAAGVTYLEITRDKKGNVDEIKEVTKKQMEKLLKDGV